MAKAGSKGKYHEWLTEEGLIRLKGWAMDGLTDKQIAHNIGVSEQTLNVWKNQYPSLFEALKNGKEVIDRQVENALLKKAMGYEYQEEVVTKIGIETITKVAHPDTTAQIFWLKNRKRVEWRDKQELEHSGEIKMPPIVIGK
jgi:DNA-binding XRE family transcriptional regulator